MDLESLLNPEFFLRLALVALVFTVCFLFRKENMRKKG
jgi:hypothetical protein